MKRVLLLAGEESGCLYADGIARELKRLAGDGVDIRGYADYDFRTADLAVMGFWAVIRRLGYFCRVKRIMQRAIDEWHPDVVCTVDYPGMNLKLAAYAKARGIRAVHVVCPQVWAWKRSRIPKIEAAVDKLCCFFPFEPSLFRAGFAEFVGHPLADAFAAQSAAKRVPGLVALLPGSRIGEIESHLPTMLEAVQGCDYRIPAVNDGAYAAICRFAEPSRVQRGGARELLRQADCAIVASGTATLEAALAGCPTVLVYRVGKVLGWLARHLITGVKHVGLANIIWEKQIGTGESPMPELLQEAFTAANVRQQLMQYLTDASIRTQAADRLAATMKLLRSDGNALAKIAGFLI